MRLWEGYRKKRREKKKLEESEFAEALAADEAEEPLAADLDVPEAEQQVAAAVSARATAELAALEADTDARRSTLRVGIDSAQQGLAAFFRKGSSSESLFSSESAFVTPVKKKRGRPSFGSQTPDQLLAAERRLEYREAERKVVAAKAQLAALKREALAQDEKQVLPSPTPPTARKKPGRPRKEASGETQLVFSAASSHGRQRGKHIKCATPLPGRSCRSRQVMSMLTSCASTAALRSGVAWSSTRLRAASSGARKEPSATGKSTAAKLLAGA